MEVLHSTKMLQKITRMYLKIRSISHWSGLVGCPSFVSKFLAFGYENLFDCDRGWMRLEALMILCWRFGVW